MPANVTIDFEKARIEYQDALTDEAKLAALIKMRSLAPAHKGGEKLRREISRKIAQFKKEAEKKKQREKKRGGGQSIAVKKEGIGQVAIVGAPNSGKSTLLNLLTGVGTKVAPYPFTTKKPTVGMMNYFGGKVQLVELPAIVQGSSAGKAEGPQILSIARNADALVVVSKNPGERKLAEKELSDAGMSINAYVEGKQLKKCVFANPFESQDIEGLKEKIFQMLGKVLVYTKKPGEEADFEAPLALPLHSTVKDVARHLHKDIARKLRFAKVWGSAKYAGQRVAKDYELKNKDIVEIFA